MNPDDSSATTAVPALTFEVPVDRDEGLISLRTVLTGALVAGVAAVGGLTFLRPSGAQAIGPTSKAVSDADRLRRRSGGVTTLALTAAPGTIDLAGRTANTWLFNGAVSAPEIRLRKGDVLKAAVRNDLPAATSVHWHGLALRNDMDGVPGLTAHSIAPGKQFDYDFVVPDAGTYWYHPHVGVQLDRGMYGPLIIEDPDERGSADVEHVLMIDDWLDGITGTPDSQYAALRSGAMGGMPGMGGMSGSGASGMGGMSTSGAGVSATKPLGDDGGDVTYPLHLFNGRPPADPAQLTARPGQRVRLRLINAGGDTAYRFAVQGHKLTVTHADGYPVQPVTVDTLVIGMGERYDVQLSAGSGAFAVVAVPESKSGPGAFAVLRTGPGRAPAAGRPLTEARGRLLTYADLQPAAGTILSSDSTDRLLAVELGFTTAGYQWLLNGKTGEKGVPPLTVSPGETVKIRFINKTGMFHPMHVHGHTFALLDPTGPGTRKDTVIVPPGQAVTVALKADNPGQWMLHCHNTYHLQQGMATVLSYRR